MFDSFIDSVQKGMQGLNKGLPTGIPALDNFISGVQRKRYYLIGANSGVGKTAFVDSTFVINPYDYLVTLRAKLESGELGSNDADKITYALAKSKIKIFYYSLEIDTNSKIAKWCSYYIYKKYKKIVSPEIIFSKKNVLSDDIYKLIIESRDYFDKLLDVVLINDNSINPTGIFMDCEAYAKSLGEWIEEDKIDPHTGNIEKVKVFRYRDSDIWPILIVDHIGLIRSEQNKKTQEHLTTKKQRIDKLSQYAISLRNNYGFTILFVSQFNRDIADINRQRFTNVKVQMEDFKDSGNPSEDANVVMGMLNPSRYNLMQYRNYDIARTHGRFRSVDIIKNRDGADDVAFATSFIGECGAFTQLPTSSKMNDLLYAQYFPPLT